MLIETTNHGPLIVRSTYWGSEYDRAGKVFASVNAGAVRLLLPASARGVIEALRGSEYAILSRGPWPDVGAEEGIEILFEDHSDNPFAVHLTAESFDQLPAEPEPGREWVLSLWDLKKGRPHKAAERKCHWRRVARLPWLKPWEG